MLSVVLTAVVVTKGTWSVRCRVCGMFLASTHPGNPSFLRKGMMDPALMAQVPPNKNDSMAIVEKKKSALAANTL